jgi:hypothetical protein
MTENTISASDNPALANDLINKALAETPTEDGLKKVDITPPSDNLVELPGGYLTPTGEVVKTAEVRELTGKDEEAIARATTVGRVLTLILSRAVVKVGDTLATEEVLDDLLAGDRDALLLGIYKATFGNPAELNAYCSGCEDYKTVNVDLSTEIKYRILGDPVGDRKFTVQGRGKEYTVILPDGRCQKELLTSTDKTVSELSTILLENTVSEIDGLVVYNKQSVKNMGVLDRRKIATEITKRNPGPQFEDLTVTCPDCESEVVVPISLGNLFRF